MFIGLSIFQRTLRANCSWSKQTKKPIQQIEFHGMLKTNYQVYPVLEKSKQEILEFHKETAKVLWEYITGWRQKGRC